jgi:hypothetical protein
VLVQFKMVQRRYRTVIDVLDRMIVTEVARRNQVSRKSVHACPRPWLAPKETEEPESAPIPTEPIRLRRLRRWYGPTTRGSSALSDLPSYGCNRCPQRLAYQVAVP